MKHYTVGQLAKLARITPRTLRHYEDKGLLVPQREENGYRIYTSHDVNRLGHILAMRACGLPLNTIRKLLVDEKIDIRQALTCHLNRLYSQANDIEQAIQRTQSALATIEGIEAMNDETKFETLKQQYQEQFERDFGEEARALYGDDVIDATNERMMAMSQEEWNAKESLEEDLKAQLRLALQTADPTSEEAIQLARMHEQWIRIHWGPGYSYEAHLGLAQTYMRDDRFRSYYEDAAGEGSLEFLIKALEAYLTEKL